MSRRTGAQGVDQSSNLIKADDIVATLETITRQGCRELLDDVPGRRIHHQAVGRITNFDLFDLLQQRARLDLGWLINAALYDMARHE